jgi:transcription termination factor 2
MEDTRLPKAVLFGELKLGGRSVGAPKKRYKDQLKKQLNLAGLQHETWQQLATDRDS